YYTAKVIQKKLKLWDTLFEFLIQIFIKMCLFTIIYIFQNSGKFNLKFSQSNIKNNNLDGIL
ncbi:hypothetical protein, partial [Lactococcus petauri]|uniref:hypothetical protein n=1 Tax=Lactococcus petauri TaxID=1940789 RepID=UPI003853CC2E